MRMPYGLLAPSRSGYEYLIVALFLFRGGSCVPAPPVGSTERLGKELADVTEHEAHSFMESVPPVSTSNRVEEASSSWSHHFPTAGIPASGLVQGEAFALPYQQLVPAHFQYSYVPMVIYQPVHHRLPSQGSLLAPYESHWHVLVDHHQEAYLNTIPAQAAQPRNAPERGVSTVLQDQQSPASAVMEGRQDPDALRSHQSEVATSSAHLQSESAVAGSIGSLVDSHSGLTLPETLPRRNNDRVHLSTKLWTIKKARMRDRFFQQTKLSGTDPSIRQKAIDDLETLSGSSFRLTIQTDPEVSDFVLSLRRGTTHEQGLEGVETGEPVTPLRKYRLDPHLLARKVFWNRKEAVQVVFGDHDRARSLLLIYAVRPAWLPVSTTQGYIGVWEIGSSNDPEALDMYLRGYYPFSPLDFEALENQPSATGRSYWIYQDRPQSRQSPESFVLSIIQSSGETAHAQPDLQELASLATAPEVQSLVHSGQLGTILSLDKRIKGRHIYAYLETPDTNDLIQRWKFFAALPPRSFIPIPLTEEQIESLSVNMGPIYREPRAVKVFARSVGEMYMLSWHKKIPWLVQHSAPVVIVWKVGPVIRKRRLLIAKGFYGLSLSRWERLTPEAIPGLRNSQFSYNLAGLP